MYPVFIQRIMAYLKHNQLIIVDLCHNLYKYKPLFNYLIQG